MNKKDKKQLGINWAFVVIGALLGLFISIFSNSIFSLYIDGFKWKVLNLLLSSGLGTVFFVGLFSYTIENLENLKDDKSTKIFIKYIKSWFKK
jgi:hypothetical protein